MGTLRYLLAIAVVLTHWDFEIPFVPPVVGGVAVQCFFVISGFYMQHLIGRRTSVHLRNFYISRAVRIFPAYWLLLAATAFIIPNGVLSFSEPHAVWYREDVVTKLVVGFTNVAIFLLDAMRFVVFDSMTDTLRATAHWVTAPTILPGPALSFLPQGWSLGIELCFYALAPLVLTRSTRVVAAWTISSFVVRGLLASQGFTDRNWYNAFFPSEFGIFLVGSLTWRLGQGARRFFTCKAATLTLLPATTLLWIVFFVRYRYLMPLDIGIDWLFPAATVLVLPFLFPATGGSRLDRLLGRMSYIVYLDHLLVAFWVERIGVSPHLRLWLALFLTTAVALVVHLLIERPLDAWRHRLKFGQRGVEPMPGQQLGGQAKPACIETLA